MNTKSIPAVLALIAGFVTCIMSFVQHVDTVVFAKRFIIVCVVFFAIGTVIRVIIHMNFKEMADGKDTSGEENLSEESEEKDTDSEENTEGTDEISK